MSQIQLTGGYLKLGVSSANTTVDIVQATFKRQYDQAEIPGSWTTGRKTMANTTFTDTMTVEYVSNNEGASAGTFQALVAHAILTLGTGELFFELQTEAGVTSATNPKVSGVLVVSDWTHGDKLGEVRLRTQEFTCKSATISIV